jgi:hypothetical protein
MVTLQTLAGGVPQVISSWSHLTVGTGSYIFCRTNCTTKQWHESSGILMKVNWAICLTSLQVFTESEVVRDLRSVPHGFVAKWARRRPVPNIQKSSFPDKTTDLAIIIVVGRPSGSEYNQKLT